MSARLGRRRVAAALLSLLPSGALAMWLPATTIVLFPDPAQALVHPPPPVDQPLVGSIPPDGRGFLHLPSGVRRIGIRSPDPDVRLAARTIRPDHSAGDPLVHARGSLVVHPSQDAPLIEIHAAPGTALTIVFQRISPTP